MDIDHDACYRAISTRDARFDGQPFVVAIIVPCHRVIGADGSLTGYGGGLPRKQWLLEHEGARLGRLSWGERVGVARGVRVFRRRWRT
jgi:O-6-methylguanine DNA methyltransferase